MIWRHLNGLYLQLLVRLLRLMAYRFSTVTEALAASEGRYACLTFDIADEHLFNDVLPALDALRAPATLFVPTAPTARQMTWGALRAMIMKGWEIGSLGHELVNLTERSYTEQRRSIMQAMALLTDHLGISPKMFAYPYGAYDATTVSCVRDAGFLGAVTLKRGSNDDDSGEQATFHLRRLPLQGSLLRDLPSIVKTVCSPSLHATAPAIRTSAAPSGVPSQGVGL